MKPDMSRAVAKGGSRGSADPPGVNNYKFDPPGVQV